jgi:class 3 adenylate cyclase
VTFLFTNIEGSTRRWEADADRMRAALAAHDEVLCRAIEEHGAGCSSTPVTACARRLAAVGG